MIRTLLLILALAVAPQAQASRPESNVWFCTLQVHLIGFVDSIRTYGKDSWRGSGPLTCRSAEGNDVPRTVEVIFNSLLGDFGADDTSDLLMTAEFWTMTPPAQFQSRTVITNPPADPYIRWEFASQLTTVKATVWAPLTPTLRSSLSQGTLFIKSAIQMAK